MFMSKMFLFVLTICVSSMLNAEYRVAIADNYTQMLPNIEAEMTELYQRAGMSDVVLEVIPGPRVLAQGYRGDFDAVDARFLFTMDGSEMLPVKVPLYMSVDVIAYGHRDRPIKIKDLDDLSNYRVVSDRGLRWAQVLAEKYPNIWLVENTITATQFTYKDRADVYLSSSLSHENMLQMHQDIDFKWIEPKSDVLMSHYLYHYVHKSHAHLIPKLEEVIQQMKDEGKF